MSEGAHGPAGEAVPSRKSGDAGTAAAPIVEARHLTKVYNLGERPLRALLGMASRASAQEVRALDDVGFRLERGVSLGVIGLNGSGKTTLLRLLAGITAPTSGTLSVGGRLSSFLSLGLGFDPELSGRRNIFLAARLQGLEAAAIEERSADIVAFAGLEEDIDRAVRTWSTGMRMRLAFAIAVHGDQDVLLVDEVLAVGDRRFQLRCLERIRLFKEAGGTLVYVSHELGTLRAVCEEALWLHRGRLMDHGDSWSVVRAYDDFARGAAGEAEGPRGPTETGSGELLLHRVELLDGDGREKATFEPDETLVIRMHYKCERRIERPNLGFAIHRNDGVLCFGTSSAKEGVVIDALEGEGRVDVELPRVGLLAGRYGLTVAAFDEADVTKYHYVEHTYGFSVRQSRKDEGVVRLPCRFLVG